MGTILIQGGRVIDPSQQLDRTTNLRIADGRIVAYDVMPESGDEIVPADGRIVAPGLVDLYVELREPGFEEDETIESGTLAALHGGFTSIACTANTDPPIDTPAGVEFVHQKAARAENCNVFVLAAVSKSRDGAELAELGSLVESGAVGFSDADRSIANSELLRRALEYCLMFDKPILNHPDVIELSQDGVMHEGVVSMLLGLSGRPSDSEDVMTGRDLRLADSTGGRLHLLNVSSGGSVELIREAKSRGVVVTASICPQNFSLTDEVLRSFNAKYKVRPPFRSSDHVEACIAGLKDGTLDVISSGHVPRAAEKKMREIDQAPFGLSSLETALSLVISRLILPGHLSWSDALAKMTVNPAQVLGIPRGTLQVGAVADVTVIDPNIQWKVEPSKFQSRSQDTPFAGEVLQGKAETVVVGGRVRRLAQMAVS